MSSVGGEKKSFVELLPPAVRPWIEKGIGIAKGLSRPARILLVSTVLTAIALGGYFSFRGSTQSYTVLFSNLDRDDAAQVIAKLKEMKVPYRIEGDGAVIEVPEDKARELRLDLAGQGLPRGGAVGFESFDKMRLGATEFEQRILYRRALEGELSRTIGAVAAVQSARVHLVLPEKSVFVSKNEPSSASVVLKLRGGRALGSGEVASIVHLVSTSVAGLSPDRVAIVTTEGLVLHKPKRQGEEGMGDDDRASQARSLEATLEERARTMVEKVTGTGHVDVRVTADIDSSRVERVEDHYDPKQTVLRSEERSVERTGGGDDVPVAGVPGAESNLPTGADKKGAGAAGADAGATATGGGGGTTREQHTRNFEVDHVTEKRVVHGGVLRRLTVAVIVDGSPVNGGPVRSKEEIEKINSLVRSAVGIDEKRGDVVTVEAVPFLAEPPAPPPPPPFKFEPKKHGPYAGGAAAAVLLLLFLVSRKIKKARKARQSAAMVLAAANAKEKAAAEAIQVEIIKEGEKAAATLLGEDGEELGSPDDLRRLVRERAALDPATAALVVRSWLGSADAAATKTSEEAA
jgi:flagellar M-ring protein FliF